jgi:hypothetical protein
MYLTCELTHEFEYKLSSRSSLIKYLNVIKSLKKADIKNAGSIRMTLFWS